MSLCIASRATSTFRSKARRTIIFFIYVFFINLLYKNDTPKVAQEQSGKLINDVLQVQTSRDSWLWRAPSDLLSLIVLLKSILVFLCPMLALRTLWSLQRHKGLETGVRRPVNGHIIDYT